MKNLLHQLDVYLSSQDDDKKTALMQITNEPFCNGDVEDINIDITIKGSDTIKVSMEKEDALELATFINFLYS